MSCVMLARTDSMDVTALGINFPRLSQRFHALRCCRRVKLGGIAIAGGNYTAGCSLVCTCIQSHGIYVNRLWPKTRSIIQLLNTVKAICLYMSVYAYMGVPIAFCGATSLS